MKPMAIIYTPDMERSKRFYTSLSAAVVVKSSSPYWTEL